MKLHAALAFFLIAAPLQAQNFDSPKAIMPSAADLKTIGDKTAELAKAIKSIRAKAALEKWLPDVEIFHDAAVNIVQHKEYFSKDSAAWSIEVLDKGLTRAAAIANPKIDLTWLDVPGKTIARGYRSQVDGTAQPYLVSYPLEFGKATDKDRSKKVWRTDVVLHGRDGSFTEVAYLRRDGKKADNQFIQIDIVGRGNNAYRWAGETDVLEAVRHFFDGDQKTDRLQRIDPTRIVLRGFSMGGAGAWHLGLHYPDRWSVMSPGAGFTTTHGYAGGLPAKLVPYQEACLSIYDAVDYAPNAAMIPVIAYSGADDPQKAAADNIEKRLKSLGQSMVHLIAPDTKHAFPPEYVKQANVYWTKHSDKSRRNNDPAEVHFTTYTLKYSECYWVRIFGLEKHYEKAEVHAKRSAAGFDVKTRNVSKLFLNLDVANSQTPIEGTKGKIKPKMPPAPNAPVQQVSVQIDGQTLVVSSPTTDPLFSVSLIKSEGRWESVPVQDWVAILDKTSGKAPGLQGPIDDGFADAFVCVRGTGKPWHDATQKYADADLARFQAEWSKFMRGRVIVKNDTALTAEDIETRNLVLFGDPASNALIGKIAAKLPLKWSSKEIVFAGETAASDSHVPVLIQRNPLNPSRYVVLNSGHTFHAKEFQGTNALLFPRLGDYALLKLAPTAKDSLNVDVVRAGLFDENWRIAGAK
jgi:dienelactone hydrolase